MPRGIHQKEKLLVLLEVLNRESDEEHPVPLSELLAALSREEISAERKSIYDDMEILRRRGWDVELERRKGYYLASRPFELAELKLLVTPSSPPALFPRAKAAPSSKSWSSCAPAGRRRPSSARSTSPAGTRP